MVNYEQKFLQAVSEKINTETNYIANYGGKRDYFVGHKFLKCNWRFVFVYKEYHLSEVFIESYEPKFAGKLRNVYDLYMEQIELLVGHNLLLVPGTKNQNLIRLKIRLDFLDSDLTMEERVQEFVMVFKRFKSILELIFKYDLNVR